MTEQKITRKPFRLTVAVDVDGVLNSYVSGWTGAGDMPDAPNRGAMQFLKDVTDDGRFEIVVVSSRLNHEGGERTVREWLWKHLRAELGENVGGRIATSLKYSETRPPAHVTLDDRGITFLGEWPSMDRLAAFQPFYKKPAGLRPDPLTSVAAVDALMQRIGRVASEVGCPDGVQALDWLEERARIGHTVATTTEVTIEKISDEDMERIRAAPIEPGAVFALPPSYWSLSEGRLRKMLETAWDLGMASEYWHDEERDLATRKLDVDAILSGEAGRPSVDGVPVLSADELPEPEEIDDDDTPVRTVAIIRADLPAQWAETARRITLDGVEHYLVEGIELEECDEETVDGISLGIGDVPERMARYAAARGKTVDEVLADPALAKPGLFHVSDEAGEKLTGGGKVEFVRKRQEAFSDAAVKAEGRAEIEALIARTERARQASLDAAFAPHAAVEAIIVAAVPAGTPISRACAGGDLGWRIGWGWMSVEGTDPSRPEQIRDFARALAAIPAMAWEKPRNGDPELVERTLAAGRAH